MKIFTENSTQKDKFRSAANKLLNNCFLIKKNSKTKNDYIFVLQHQQLFEEYFDLLGYKILVNEMQGVAGLININGTGRLRLKKMESIILLILRLLYIEKKKGLSLSDHVMVTSGEIQDKFALLNIKSKTVIDKTSFKESIRVLKRFNITINLDTDIFMPECRLIIYPSVLLAIPNNNLDKIHDAAKEKLLLYMDVNSTDINSVDDLE